MRPENENHINSQYSPKKRKQADEINKDDPKKSETILEEQANHSKKTRTLIEGDPLPGNKNRQTNIQHADKALREFFNGIDTKISQNPQSMFGISEHELSLSFKSYNEDESDNLFFHPELTFGKPLSSS